jgi:hypothetical protein
VINPNCNTNDYLQQFPNSVYYGGFKGPEQGIVSSAGNNGAPNLDNGNMPVEEVMPQLAVATVQAHNDKVIIRVSKSGWLNFPNWACYVPSVQYFQGDPRYETGAF